MRNPVRCMLIALTVLLAVGAVAVAQTTQTAAPKGDTLSTDGSAAPAEVKSAADAPAEPTAAEGQGDETPAVPAPENTGPFDNPTFLIIMVGMIVLMYVWMGRSKKKQANKRKEMLANLRKGDKVRTIGGILGTVVEIRETEVIIKIDENTGARMHFIRDAVHAIGDDARKSDEDAAK